MQRVSRLPVQICLVVAGIVVGGACLLGSSTVGFAEPGAVPPTNAATSGASEAATASGARDDVAPARAGRWIKVDPQTGKPVAPAAPPGAAIAADPAFSTSHQGLVPQPAPGGGVMIDLQGRFRSAASATVGRDGKVAVDCVPPGTAAREE